MDKGRFMQELIALFLGTWMIFDGFHVIINGKYFGSEKPGPWSDLVRIIGLNPDEFGSIFILLGMFWIIVLGLIHYNRTGQNRYGAIASILSLWYLPFGTLLSLTYLIISLKFQES